MENPNRYRLLYVERLLRETDAENALTNAEMMQKLEERYNLKVHRTTIPEDIKSLVQSGLDIVTVRTRPKKYYLNDNARVFKVSELKILADAVASSKCITKTKSDDLIEKIRKIAPPSGVETLKRNLWTENRIKNENENIFDIINAINDAINTGKKISFQYFTYDQNKKRVLKHKRFRYYFSPYALIWNGDYYYVVGYSDKHEMICTFRVDRIAATPEILKDDAVEKPKDFYVSDYVNGMLHMYNGERTRVTLLCENSTMDAIVDKFGPDVMVEKYNNRKFWAEVEIATNHVFYLWLFGFGGQVRILSPEKTNAEYKAYIKENVRKMK